MPHLQQISGTCRPCRKVVQTRAKNGGRKEWYHRPFSVTRLFIIRIEKFLQTALTSRTIGIRNALSLMMRLYPLIKIPPPRFLKNVPSIKIWRSKLPECGRETWQRNSRKHQPLGNSKDNITGNGTYSTEGPIHQVTIMTKEPSSASGSRFGLGPWRRNTVLWAEPFNYKSKL